METMQRWARSWLEGVRQGVRALERERRAAEARCEAVLRLGSPMASGPHGKGGAADPMAAVDAMVDAEAGADGLEWAREGIAEFYAMGARVRGGCAGEILDGVYAAEYVYAMDLGTAEAAAAMGCSRATVARRIDALIDYLDYIGPSVREREPV